MRIARMWTRVRSYKIISSINSRAEVDNALHETSAKLALAITSIAARDVTRRKTCTANRAKCVS